jgi:hypothetical protein
MAISPHTREVLDRQGIDVVRAKHIKEIAVTNDPEGKIAFGNDEVKLGEVQQWLSEKARSDSNWKVATGFAAVAAAAISLFAFLVGAWQAHISSDTEQRGLRAYVYAAISAAPYAPAKDQPPDRYAISLAVVNSGKTWARNLQIRKKIVTDQIAEPFNAAELNKETTSPIFLGPGQQLDFQLGIIPIGDLPRLVKDNVRYFYVAWITYEDTFSDTSRQTQVSVRTAFDLEGIGHVSLGYMPTHNCADDDCLK